MEDKDFKQKLIKISIIFTALVVFILGFDKIRWLVEILLDAFSPFIIGGVLALLLNIPVRFFEKNVFRIHGKIGQKINRPLSILASLIVVAIIIGLVCLIIVPEVVETVSELAKAIPEFLSHILELVEKNINLEGKALEELNALKDATESWASLMKYATNLIAPNAGNAGDVVDSAYNLVGNIFSFGTSLLIAIFFALYSIIEKENISGFFHKCGKTFFSESKYKYIAHSLKLCHQNIEDFFFGQCLESFIVATIFTIITSIFGFKCSIVVGIAMAFLALIPYVGNFVACGIGVILVLATESPTRALIFLAIFGVVQLLDAYFLYPRVIGLKVNMPPLAIFVSALVGGSLFGAVGLFFTIPFTTTIYMLIKEKMIEKGVEKNSTINKKEKKQDKVYEKKIQEDSSPKNRKRNKK